LEAPYKERGKEKIIAERTLYDCSHARVSGSRIYCDRGYKLSRVKCDGSLDINRLERDIPLALAICQDCIDFDSLRTLVPDHEKGWLK